MASIMRRSTFLRLCAVAPGLSAAQQKSAPALTLEQVKGGLHVIIGDGGNVTVLPTSEGVVLVDDKFDRDIPEILAKVRTLTGEAVRYVLTTHHHGDHTGGNPQLIGRAEIIAHQNARVNMAKGSQPGLPRVSFSDEAGVYLGGQEMRLRHFGRGHTNGDAVIHFPAQRVLASGDLFISGAPFIDYGNGGSGVAWTTTLENALQLDFDTVIPGHGPVMTRQNLIDWIASFKTVRARITAMLREKASKADIAASLKVDDLAGWSVNPNWTKRSLGGLIDELAR